MDAEELVPGDIIVVESGKKVPADVRLLSSIALEVDESLLTGESLPVGKKAEVVLSDDAGLADRANMAFAGTLVSRGKANGVVVATGLLKRLGHIASSVVTAESAKAPLLIRMERLTSRIGWIMMVAVFFWGAFP